MPSLEDFLLRIQNDYEFYFQFRQDPEKVLASFQLTPEERTAVSGSDRQPWEHVERSSSYWKIGCNYVMLESEELEFSAAAALGRPGVQHTIDKIRGASSTDQRLTPVLALMEQIG
jgi:hypothetical protein